MKFCPFTRARREGGRRRCNHSASTVVTIATPSNRQAELAYFDLLDVTVGPQVKGQAAWIVGGISPGRAAVAFPVRRLVFVLHERSVGTNRREQKNMGKRDSTMVFPS